MIASVESEYLVKLEAWMDISKLEMREACPDDIVYILRLHRELGDQNDPELSLTKAYQVFERIEQYPDYKLYVATQDGEILGTFALLIMDNLAHGGAKSGVLEDMVVDHEGRGLGIGRSMVEEAIRICRVKGCYKVSLSSNLTRDRAHEFYESLEFTKHGYSFVTNLSD